MAIQRINRRAVILVHAGSAQGELREIGFADDLHVASPGRRQTGRVAGGGRICVRQIFRSSGRHLSLHVDDVLNREAKFPRLAASWPIFDESVIASGARPGSEPRHRAALETNRQEQPQKEKAGQNKAAILSYACTRNLPGRTAPPHRI